MNHPVFDVHLFYVIFIYQKRPVAAHKVIAQCVRQLFYRAGKFNLAVFSVENDLMDIAGGLKKENVIIIHADFPSAEPDSTGLMCPAHMERMAFHCI